MDKDGRSRTVALTASVVTWFAASTYVAITDASGVTMILVALIAVDGAWLVACVCESPLTPAGWTAAGARTRRSIHPAHLLALGGLGILQVLTHHGLEAVAGGVLGAAVAVNGVVEINAARLRRRRHPPATRR